MVPNHRIASQHTREWLERAVIGLNLCPFAKAVHAHGLIHFALSTADDHAGLLADLERELLDLQGFDPKQRDTTLLVLPDALHEFRDMLDFLGEADSLLGRMRLQGVIQIAGFHPGFQFAGTAIDDIENFTNRSPFPLLHLLREESVDRAVAAIPDPGEIYRNNIARLRSMGHEGWQALAIGIDRGS